MITLDAVLYTIALDNMDNPQTIASLLGASQKIIDNKIAQLYEHGKVYYADGHLKATPLGVSYVESKLKKSDNSPLFFIARC